MLSGCNIVQPPRNRQYYVQIFVKLSHALSSGKKIQITGKSLLEALILGSTNPQYDKRLFIDLPVKYIHENYKLRTCCLHILFCFNIQNNICTQHVLSL